MKTCPSCKNSIDEPIAEQDQQWLPFCCERCKLIDFGAWMDGSHAIPGEETFIMPGDTDNDILPH